MNIQTAWDRRFRAGKYDFLRKPAETLRLDAIAEMIAAFASTNGPLEVADLGCGEGLLLPKLGKEAVARYLALDISAEALLRLPVSPVPAFPVHSTVSAWDGKPAPVAPRILVASEVLYYEPEGGAALARLMRAPGTAGAIVSCVAGRPDKPNWQKGADRLWSSLDAAGLRRVEERKVADAGTSWDIVRFAL